MYQPRLRPRCGLALVHARALADVLGEVDDPGAITTVCGVEPRFQLRAGEVLEGAAGDDLAVRFARGAPHAAERDPVVRRALHRCFQLLDPPSDYWGSADIRARVEEVWRDIEVAPPPPSGPDYQTMGRLLTAAV